MNQLAFHRRLLAAAAVTFSIVVIGLPTDLAFADEGAADKPVVENVDATTDVVDASDPGGKEAKLMDFKSWMLEQPGIEDSGYIESVNDAASSSTVLLWHGQSPLQQIAIDKGAELGIAVTIRPREYDRPTLEAAAAQALDLKPEQLSGFKVSGAVAVTADYDGVIIEGTSTEQIVSATGLSVRTATLRSATRDGVPAITVRAKFADGGAPAPIANTRDNDVSPFNAGGFMLDPVANNNVSVCSTGFSIKRNGRSFTTTARHCWNHRYRAYSGTHSYGDGVVNSGDGAGRQLSASGSALMFDGAYNNSAGYSKKVIGYQSVGIGSKVCVSGGNSGVHCGLTIRDSGFMWNDGFSRVSLIRAYSSGTNPAATRGDSGGPVFVTAGTGKVRAVGMMQWANFGDGYLRACSARTQLVCSSVVGFSLMSVIVNTIPGASLTTTS